MAPLLDHDTERSFAVFLKRLDLVELWRTNSNYSVIQTLEQLNPKDKNHFVTDTYEAMLSERTIRLLFQNFKLG